ncbi:MAG: hypothetical protein ABH872_03150 [Candidatus Omnitrophota bacterium]
MLSIFCLGMGVRSYIEVRRTKLLIDKARSRQLSLSGIILAREILNSDKEKSIDHLKEDWAKFSSGLRKINYSKPQRTGYLKLEIEDESSRFNIYNATQEKLVSFFESFEIDNAQEKTGRLLDYTDKDTDERYPDSESKAKNNPLSIIEEMLLVGGISKADFDKLKGVISLYSGEKININTARQELLNALIDDSDSLDTVMRVRLGDDILDPEDDKYFEKESDIPQNITSLFSIRSDIFRIISTAEAGGVKEKNTCIFNRDSGKIIYWHEE